MARKRNRRKARQELITSQQAHEVQQQRAHGGAVSHPQFMNLSDVYQSPRRGTKELLRIYRESPWLRAIVGKIARTVAETDWMLLAKKNSEGRFVQDTDLMRKGGEQHERAVRRALENNEARTITNHPMLAVLHNGTGNPRLNGFGVFQVTQEHLDLTGEAFWIKERDQFGIPIAVWPLPPSWVMSLPTEREPYYTVSAPGGLRVEIPVTEIVPFIDPDPENPYGRGVGTAMSLDDEIQIDEFAAKHQKSFFLNRARPDIIISGQFISPKDAERLEVQWKSDHQGFWKAFKPLFFSQKIDVKELSQSFESMQMVQVRKQERDTFISVFGAPPEKFGIIGESKRSTIQAADYFWTKDIIKPRVEMLRRSMQQMLVPDFDERLILSYDTPVIQDDEFRLQVLKQAPWSITINEWRAEAGKPSLGPRGDVLMVPLNMQIIPVNKGDELVAPSDDEGEDEDNKPEDPVEEMLEANRRALAARGPQPEMDSGTVVRDIVQEVTQALTGVLEDKRMRLGRPD